MFKTDDPDAWIIQEGNPAESYFKVMTGAEWMEKAENMPINREKKCGYHKTPHDYFREHDTGTRRSYFFPRIRTNENSRQKTFLHLNTNRSRTISYPSSGGREFA